MRNFTMIKHPFILLSFFAIIATNLKAQKKISLDINFTGLRSIGYDITKIRQSNMQPLTVYYFSRKKFEQPYFNILGNLAYAVNPNILMGLQTGIYAHFSERYFGFTKSLTVSVPVMITGRVNVMKINSRQIGINFTAGKNFFDIHAGEMELKNGLLFNESVFCIIKKSRILKLGIEQEVDNEYFYFTADNPLKKNETFEFHLNRLSLVLSYGIIFKSNAIHLP